ncbi:MAG: SGNH/GDSL hydrolase family protein [Anaerolineae bacterium]
MRGWEWLTKFKTSWGFALRVIAKAAVLFVLVNLLFVFTKPLPAIGQISVYNGLVPGRDRLPYGEDPTAYNLSMNSIEAMFASHIISRAKAPDEYRVLVIGDSSVWGILLHNDETLTGNLNAMNLTIDGRRVVAYNLGHPILSVTKDLMLLDYAMQYQPDLILWFVSLESMPYSEQLRPPLVANNADRVRDLIARYDLPLNPDDSAFVTQTVWDETLIGQRRALADWLRLQNFGFAWAGTGVDQVYGDFTARANDFEADPSWKEFTEPTDLPASALAFDVISAGHNLAGEIPVRLVNEPIYRADGTNSDIRYDAWYPRWAYDQYRALLADQAAAHGWQVLDLWDAIEPAEFTDSPVHLTPSGSRTLSEQIAAWITAP